MIPRKSGQEKQIADWLVSWSQKHGFDVKQDSAMNVYIYVPASAGREKAPIVILQAHMDMVCEKTPESAHDFRKDPVKPVTSGDWLCAETTSLGADNGIGMAFALAMATDVSHPPLELLFTADEETGLWGAKSIVRKNLAGRILINLDSEEEGVFTIGCAGGRDTNITLPLSRKKLIPGKCFKMAIDGLRGGHSGIDIHKQRENAIVLLARLLRYLEVETRIMHLGDMAGGSAHNAIPRSAYAVAVVPNKQQSTFRKVFFKAAANLKQITGVYEPGLKISLAPIKEKVPACSSEDTVKIIRLLNALPHGAAKMTANSGLVETSNNLATLSIDMDNLNVLSSQRSFTAVQLDWITGRIESVAALAGARYVSGEGYPGWQPNLSSKILKLCKHVYTRKFGKEPRVEAVHAGLECGIIGAKFRDMDMISMGPTIKNPHCPQERLFLPSLSGVWDFLAELMKEIQ